MPLGTANRNREAFVPPKLQITAMMDMFTIIVFFLLFSYADRPDEVELNKAIELPVSSAERDYDNTIKVFLSPSNLKIEDQIVADIRKDKIIGYDPENPQESAIYKALEKIRKDKLDTQLAEAPASDAGEVAEENAEKDLKRPQVLFFCDKSVPFRVINTVMKTIGMVGYPNMQFAVTGER